jgi:glycosyltransferase involved in cell wall biosynthesis
MSNAAIFLHPDGYDTSRPRLLGRHSAGESFLRGFLRHADVEQLYLWNAADKPQAELEALVARIGPPRQPITWIASMARGGLKLPGVLNLPSPDLSGEAWARRAIGANAYGICGITHTTATATVMRLLGDMLVSPTEAYDALICTSAAVRASVETQLEGMRDYLTREFGPRRRAEPMRATIPLGVNVADFATTPADRKAWRERLDIPGDAVVALYVGRFNAREKMNPSLMALALEKAVQHTGRPIYWVNSGWAESEADAETYHAASRALCPSVHYRIVDGRPPEVRFSIWSVADFFISFSDNIQETFGLTPVEAMAAGLPCVVTDWNGYKDTVRQGEDGFRIPTYAPRPGDGGDFAYWFATGHLSYTGYVGGAAQYTAIDFAQSTSAISALVLNADYRRHLGEQAKAQARRVFDWAAIIPQYQALWAEQNARRRAAPPAPPDATNPFRPDPFTLFGAYPTHHLTPSWSIALSPGMTWDQAAALLANPLANQGAVNRPTLAEIEQLVTWLADRKVATTPQALSIFPVGRHGPIGRGLLWLARFGVITLIPPA